MKLSLIRAVLTVTRAALLATGTPQIASAGMIGTSTVLAAEAAANREQNLARIDAQLARADVRDQLSAWGVDEHAASERVAQLSDVEVADLAKRIEQAPTGGILALIGAVFVVLLILDYLGVTKVFRRH
jgi:hypothetical protein